MRYFKRRIGLWSILAIMALILPIVLATPVFALTTADVTVNATPSYVAITVNITAYTFGIVTVSTNYSTALGYFGIDNTSTVVTNQTISVTGATWTGGVPWTHSDAGTPAADTVALFACKDGGAFDVIVQNVTPLNLALNQAATTDYSFGLRLATPTAFTDGVLKDNTVRITAVAA